MHLFNLCVGFPLARAVAGQTAETQGPTAISLMHAEDQPNLVMRSTVVNDNYNRGKITVATGHL